MSYFLGQPKIDVAITRKKVYTPLGYPVNLMCLATNPLPVRYSWSKDGETIRNSTRIKVYKNIIVVIPKRSKDFGTYVCNATNIAGSTNYSIELIQQNKQRNLCKYKDILQWMFFLYLWIHKKIKWKGIRDIDVYSISSFSTAVRNSIKGTSTYKKGGVCRLRFWRIYYRNLMFSILSLLIFS